MEFPQKMQSRSNRSSTNSTPGYISEEENEITNLKIYTHPSVPSSIISSGLDMAVT